MRSTLPREHLVKINIGTILLCLVATGAAAQPDPLTLEQAVQQALSKYPAVRVSQEQVSAAAAAIKLARTSYLPRVDFLAQANRATHNNVFGMLLPQPVISPISGPVLSTNSLNNVWGTAVGALVSWEPFDFGLRKANIEIAESARNRAGAQVNVTKLQVAAAAADAYLTILAAQQTVTAAKAGVERARVLNQIVGTLVQNELRPGAEASRTRAELAVAETQLIQAEEAVDVGRATLAQLLGVSPQTIVVQSGQLLELPRDRQPPEFSAATHPFAVSQNLTIAEVKSREKALNRSYYPRFNLQATSYARGTGIQPNGATGGAASGLGPNIQNWAIGLSVTFPAFEIASIRARREIEAYNERAEAARYDQVIQDITGQIEKANATVAGARRIAQNTPIQLQAARDTEQQASARYKAGLGNIVEVADAQRILTQAEIDDALAKLGVWRALLSLSAASGDVQAFVQRTIQ
jgi:outer membrane protein